MIIILKFQLWKIVSLFDAYVLKRPERYFNWAKLCSDFYIWHKVSNIQQLLFALIASGFPSEYWNNFTLFK